MIFAKKVKNNLVLSNAFKNLFLLKQCIKKLEIVMIYVNYLKKVNAMNIRKRYSYGFFLETPLTRTDIQFAQLPDPNESFASVDAETM